MTNEIIERWRILTLLLFEHRYHFAEVQMPQNAKRWWYDYEVYEEELIDDYRMQMSDVDFGTPNPNILPSNIPCGGCGANLHCRVCIHFTFTDVLTS